jgi:hypothetical protein
MLVVAFIQWWYGPGWRDASSRLLAKIHETYLNFSMPILLRTMFAPWRRIITPPGGSLEQRVRALLDNTVSRLVGFAVRLIALIAACVLIALYTLIGGLIVLLWPVLPILGPALVVGGLL